MSDQEQQACPVDHQAREAWVRAAKAQSSSQSAPQPSQSSPLSGTCDSSTLDQPQPAPTRPRFTNTRNPLSTDREISSIPRYTPGQDHDWDATLPPASSSPNAQSEHPIMSDGKWVYPSESQFHAALVRKHGAQNAPPENTMKSIIPIHNAVNERTWTEILRWERSAVPSAQSNSALPSPAASADPKETTKDVTEGPQLVSFKGDSQKLTPRARFKSLMGYQAPFDRHDWIVRRHNGEQLEYVIDFYSGKMGGKVPLSFYLDVRPKLNTWEGWRMRFARFWGLS